MPNAAAAKKNPAPKKKISLAAHRKKRKAKRSNPAPAPRSNPGAGHDFTHVILPGFAAYALVRIAQRIAFTLVGRRWPRMAKHAHAGAGVLAATGAWFGAHRLPKVGQFHDSIVMGSSIAAIQGVWSSYVPQKYNWLLADCRATDVKPAALPPVQMNATNMAAVESDDNLDDLAAQLGSLAGSTLGGNAGAGSPPVTSTTPGDMDEDDELADVYTGAFAN